MRRATQLIQVGLSFFACVGTSQAPAQAPAARVVTLPAPMIAVHEREAAAWLRGDPAGTAQQYSADVWFRGQALADAVGRDALERLLVDHFQRFKYSAVRWEPEEYISIGEFAHETGRIIATRRAAGDSVDRGVTFRYQTLWKRAADGSWLPFRVMNNGYVAPAPARP